MICVDASLVVKLLIPEPDSPAAFDLWKSWATADEDVRAPWLIDYEVASTLRLLAYRGELTVGESAGRFEDFLSLPIDKEHSSAIPLRAIGLAAEIGQPRVYDTAYLALAERHRAPLWTADRRFWNAAHERFPWVHRL